MLEELTVCEEVFHTASGVAYADLITDGHRETWPIRSKRFRTWVRRCYYRATGAAPDAAVLGPALDLLEARAQFDALERAVHIRVAEHAGRTRLRTHSSGFARAVWDDSRRAGARPILQVPSTAADDADGADAKATPPFGQLGWELLESAIADRIIGGD